MYRQYDPDVILINGHGNKETDNIKIWPYYVHQKNRTQTRTDGVAIAIKPTLQYKLLDNFSEDTLAIKIQTQQGPLIIATIYQPPRRAYLPTQDILALLRHSVPTYIIGDLNCAHTTFGYDYSNTAGNSLVRLMGDRRLRHLGPHFPTYHRQDTATTPDIIIANNLAHHNIHTKQGDISTSDHIPIITRISTNPIQIPTPQRRNYNRADWQGFKATLLNTPDPPPLTPNTPTNTIDSLVDGWYADLQTAVDTHIPMTSYRTLPHYKDNHQLKLLKTQYAALQQYSQTHGWDRQLYNQYRQLQQQIQDANITLHNNLWTSLTNRLCSNHHDAKEFFAAYRRIMGTQTTPTNTHYLINANNERLETKEEMEEEHRRHWTQVFQITPQENAQFDANTEHMVNTHLQQHAHLTTPTPTIDLSTLDANNPLIAPITLEETLWAIKDTKPKTPGPSQINKAILSHTTPNMTRRLTNIFNMSLATGHYPKKFKHANIILIHKPGTPIYLTTSKRPISLLEVPGKLLEKIINRRLRIYLEDNDVYNKRQYGFRQHKGTEHAIALAWEEIAQSQALRKKNNVILRDVSKAFDKVWHGGLKYKLIRLDLPDNLTRLLCDFLNDRTASIQLGTYTGPPIHLHSGTPQGAILSPTLYIIYTHDIPPPTIPFDNYTLYADDITQTITHPSKSHGMLRAKTMTAITRINHFEKQWKIKTNTDKFKLISIQHRLNTPFPITINNTRLEYETNGKFLGLEFTPYGIKKHIDEREARARFALTKLKRFASCTTKTKTRLYTSLIRPILEFPAIPLNTLSRSALYRLQKVQNRALRWATNTYYPSRTTTQQIHEQLKIQPLNIRIHNRAKKTLDRLEALEDEQFTTLLDRHDQLPRDIKHRNWPRAFHTRTDPPPQPFYTLPRRHIRQQQAIHDLDDLSDDSEFTDDDD